MDVVLEHGQLLDQAVPVLFPVQKFMDQDIESKQLAAKQAAHNLRRIEVQSSRNVEIIHGDVIQFLCVLPPNNYI